MMEHQNNDEQGNRHSAPPASLGTMLREAREHLNFSVADVAVLIKFAPRQIEALEADDFKRLPEAAFLRGFVRSYAKILNLDAQPLLAALPREKMPSAELAPASVEVPYPVDNASQKQTLILLGAALLLAVVAVGFSVWHFTNPLRQSAGAKPEFSVASPAEKQAVAEPQVEKHAESSSHSESKRESSATIEEVPARPEKTKTVAAVAIGQPSATVAHSSVRAARTKAAVIAAQSSVQAARTKAVRTEPQAQTTDSGNMDDAGAPAIMLKLVFDEESWAEIKDKDGKLISSQINPRGSELNVKGRLPLSLVIGHAATTHVYKDGEPVDLTPFINSSSEVARVTLE